MSSLVDADDTKLVLDNDTKIKLNNAEDIRLQRERLKHELLVDVIYAQLDNKVKNAYLSVYKCTDKELKVYIADYAISIYDSIAKSYSGDTDSIQLSSKYRTFTNNFSAQKLRWVKLADGNLKKNDISVQKYKAAYYSTLDISAFTDAFIIDVQNWKSSSSSLMIDFPLYPYMNNIRSKKSAFNYDVGMTIYEVLSKSNYVNENLIYRQIDVLVDSFSPYSRKIPKYEVVKDEAGKSKDLLVNQTTFNNGEIEIQEQMSILNTVNDTNKEAKRQLNALFGENDELTSETQAFVDSTVKSNKLMFQPFDDFDLAIISYTINNSDSSFYLDRKITVVEKDILNYLGKNPNQPKNRTWLRTRFSKISGKQIIIVEKKNTNTKIVFDKFVVFERVVFDVTNSDSLKSIDVYVSSKIYNNILKEDTINVYKNEFMSIKNSKYPNAILLIFNLQLLRFSSYQMNKTTVQIATSYFVKLLKITSKNKVTITSTIEDYLNQFKQNRVIVQSFEYIAQQQAWLIEFIELTTTDLKVLMNSRKDYGLPARKFTYLLND